MAIGIGQKNYDGNTTGGTSISTTLTGTVAGSTIEVWVQCFQYSFPEPSVSVSDSQGNTYTEIGTYLETDGLRYRHFYAKNIIGGAGVNTVTATFTQSTTYRMIVAQEILDADTSAPLIDYAHATQAAPGTGTDGVTTGNMTLVSGNALVSAAAFRVFWETTVTAGTSHTSQQGQDSGPYGASWRSETRGVTVAADYAATFTVGNSGGTISLGALWKEAAAPAIDGVELTSLHATASERVESSGSPALAVGDYVQSQLVGGGAVPGLTINPNGTFEFSAAATVVNFQVRFYDFSVGDTGDWALQTVVDEVSPTPPGAISVENNWETFANVTFGASTDDFGVTNYQYRVNGGSWVDLALQTAFTINGLTAATSYFLEVRAQDAAGNNSLVTDTTFVTPDLTSPSAPGSLTVTVTGETTATATYTAASDNVGVYFYESSLDGGTWQGRGQNLTFNLTDLTAGTTYSLRVRAGDEAGNVGSALTAVFTTDSTPVVTPPAEPTPPGTVEQPTAPRISMGSIFRFRRRRFRFRRWF